MTRPARAALLACALVFGLTGCDSSPSDAGTYTVAVEWDAGMAPLGGALVFLGAPGLGTASAQGGALLWQNTPPGEEGGLRVLVIHTGDPGSLEFTIRAEGRPAATLLTLTTQTNDPLLPTEGYHVRVFRSE
jgi:hypothetical protein